MTVAITSLDLSSPGDGLGTKGRTGGGFINTNFSNLKAAVEELQGRHFTVQNASVTVALGKRYMCNAHAGITLTLPATFAVSATVFSDLQIVNADDASDVTITPASGDALFVDGVTLGVDVSKVISPGYLVILSPRTANSEWDLVLLTGINPITSFSFKLGDEDSDLTTGLKVTIRPLGFAFTLTEIRGGVKTAPTGSILIMDVHAGGTTIMTTDKISIDATEDTSETAATPPALTTTAIADDEKLEFYVDQIGSTVAGTGAYVTLIGRKT